jgi:hypothetical protein
VAVARAGAMGPRAKRGTRAFPSLSMDEAERLPAAAAAAMAAKRCGPCDAILSARTPYGVEVCLTCNLRECH